MQGLVLSTLKTFLRYGFSVAHFSNHPLHVIVLLSLAVGKFLAVYELLTIEAANGNATSFKW